jgi:hypothetical protein
MRHQPSSGRDDSHASIPEFVTQENNSEIIVSLT